jgi:hypothetical protein
MKKFWRGFRNASDTAERQDAVKLREQQLQKLRRLLEIGGHEAESEYVELLKEWVPEITKEELALRIKQFHDAVNARQSRDRESR